MTRTHEPIHGVYVDPRPDWLVDRSQPIPRTVLIRGSTWDATKAITDPVMPEALDAAANEFAEDPLGLSLLAAGWLRRDVAIAVAIRVVDRALTRRPYPYAVDRTVAVLRRIDATNAEVLAAVGGLTDPPSLTLLAWAAQWSDTLPAATGTASDDP